MEEDLEILIMLIVIIVIGFVAYKLYQAKKFLLEPQKAKLPEKQEYEKHPRRAAINTAIAAGTAGSIFPSWLPSIH
ncbi:MAG: hypothetical protein ACXVJE_19535 [Mucilaginibacter sp.]